MPEEREESDARSRSGEGMRAGAAYLAATTEEERQATRERLRKAFRGSDLERRLLAQAEEASASMKRGLKPPWLPQFHEFMAMVSRPRPMDDGPTFQKQGDMWRVVYDGVAKSIRHSKGMVYIQHLLRNPGKEVHAAALRGLGTVQNDAIPCSSAGPILDGNARQQYKERIAGINNEIADAETNNDAAWKERLVEEREALVSQVAGATGLFGDKREALSDRERHRQAVSVAIHRALRAIKREREPLWQHLSNSLRIGEYLSYQPDKPTSWTT